MYYTPLYMRRISTFSRVKCFLKKENLTSHLEILCTVFRQRLRYLKLVFIRLIGFYISRKHKLNFFITLWLLNDLFIVLVHYFVVRITIIMTLIVDIRVMSALVQQHVKIRYFL